MDGLKAGDHGAALVKAPNVHLIISLSQQFFSRLSASCLGVIASGGEDAAGKRRLSVVWGAPSSEHHRPTGSVSRRGAAGALSIFARATDCASFQLLLQHLRGLMQRVAHRRHLANRIEEAVIVDQILVTGDRNVHIPDIKLARMQLIPDPPFPQDSISVDT
jgi:hypothetical protein